MNRPIFALIDCNNFFVSCEQIFRPDLAGKPVVVLSSNDGCVVARSNEAKALGIRMAAPAFKHRQVFDRHGVVQFSANFELYGDISRRITEILTTITPRIEVYSVDESFLDLSQLPIGDYARWGRIVREQIYNWVGVTVSIGIAPTKTLAKLASERSKKDPGLNGVLSLIDSPRREFQAQLEATQLKDIWGIGWRLTPKIRGYDISNAWQLARMRPRQAQQLMGIHGRQVITELNGTSCYPLDMANKVRKSIARTRTFGEDVNDFNAIASAIASFAAQAAFRLRVSRQLTRRAGIFLATNKHKPGYRMRSQELHFEVPTADTGQLISRLVELLGRLYESGTYYYRAGVFLWDFMPQDYLQTDAFGSVSVSQHQTDLVRMETIDKLNERYGKRTIRYAAEDLGRAWKPRYKLRSPRYVTRWDELPTVKIRNSW